ncbi:MAG: hypothetical protein RL497_1241 [Pseudomonadota bacterium]|jgi:hypothetical protein
MSFVEPTDAETRSAFINASHFFWPTFEHLPLNCFDIGVGMVLFPGEISEDRAQDPSYFAGFKTDINDDTTCPRISESTGDELWNEASIAIRWFFGRIKWACMVDMDSYVLKKGYFCTGIGVVRFQNMAEITDIQDRQQLKKAIQRSFEREVALEFLQPLNEHSFFEKEINGANWFIARTFNALGYPEYLAVLPIDSRTVIHVPAALENCWDRDETIPPAVEQKHLASFWDFLGQIQLVYDRTGEWETGSQVREAPGQAQPIPQENLPEW